MRKYFYLFFTFAVLSLGVYIGYRLFSPSAKQEHVAKNAIVRELQDEGFLITQTYLINQSVSIDRNTGNAFRDFFWGQDIKAAALVKVGSGVNLHNISEEHITLNRNIVRLDLPKIEHYSAEVVGEIMIQNNQGLFKKLFDRDDGYQSAYEQLRDGAFKAASEPALITTAEKNAELVLTKLVKSLAGDREVVVTFK